MTPQEQAAEYAEVRDRLAHESLERYDEREKQGGAMLERHFSGFCWGYDAGFTAGAAHERARAEALVEAIAKVSNIIARPISMTDAIMQLSEIETRLDEALAQFRSDGGKNERE